eukprot:TRINITY_DN19220_c0_g1_i4.p2 TRINITY_DN19220_c0_g1~~TRINITY_DN19220_c0_g1_i4.p2  ORF type:complete len:162 (-),score=22.80 TRINITY_DN19220_c0_g1_i4:188-673(-)
MMEKDRDDRGGLTRWLTGRRFVYIRIPTQPLPEKVNIGNATATVYHREQKLKPENQVCSRCFTKGHAASTCQNDIVCRTCKNSGHKMGHPSCPLTSAEKDKQTSQTPPQHQPAPEPERATSDGLSAPAETSSVDRSKPASTFVTPQKSARRGRDPGRPTLK